MDATEIWLHHPDAPLILSVAAADTGPCTDHRLGPDLETDRPQVNVPTDHWQSARSTGAFTLASCAVSPGFLFSSVILAPQGFDIPRN